MYELRRKQIATRHLGLTHIEHRSQQEAALSKLSKSTSLPVHDYDPVRCYLNDLRNAFDDIALFFCDTYGGDVIGVIWKPLASGSLSLDKNVVVDDFKSMGAHEKLVKRVHVFKTLK